MGAYGVKTSLWKIEAVVQWPIPTSVKHVGSFLGMADFKRISIRFSSEIANPLTDLSKKGRAEIWSP